MSNISEHSRPDPGLTALVELLRFHGLAGDPAQLRHDFGPTAAATPLDLVRIARRRGLKARSVQRDWAKLDGIMQQIAQKDAEAAETAATFNFPRYGLLDGNVTNLSHDVVDEPNARPEAKRGNDKVDDSDADRARKAGYVACVALDRDWMGTENGRIQLGPGMAVNVEIHTGKRSIISYLLSPLATKMQESGHER